ncbi:MAG: hypothetical protein KJN63_02865 [Acidimicrobiia bacterium]|nr:hypothetical protein [Acidimicrobiia bacterium]
MESSEALRYGLYAVTALLGLSLFLWMRRSRKIHLQNMELLESGDRAADHAQPSEKRLRTIRGLAFRKSMADALAGIRLPVHWQPDPAVEVSSRLTLTTGGETPVEMASLLSGELVRLGYRVRPTGGRSAVATRDTNAISIVVDFAGRGSLVSSHLTLNEADDG